MFNYIKSFLTQPDQDKQFRESGVDSNTKLQIATCALFLEVANSDDVFSDDERKFISRLMKKEFDLNDDEFDELCLHSKQRMKENVSLYEYTDVINSYYDKSEKYEILKNLWKLILVDGKLDAHEEHFIRLISTNLKMEHKELIAAKLEAKKILGLT